MRDIPRVPSSAGNPLNVNGIVRVLYAGIGERTGASVDTHGVVSYRDGYLVSLRDQEVVFPLSLPSVDTVLAIRDYVVSKAAMVSVPGHVFGVWVDTPAGAVEGPAGAVVYLDVSRHVAERADAERLGQLWGQLAIYDVAHGDVIFLNED